MGIVTTYTATSNFTLNAVVSPPPAGNDLATAAAALVPGSGATSYASFAIPTYGTLSGLTGDGLDWNIRMHWDATNLYAYLMYKAANQTNAFRLVRYAAATNTWSIIHSGGFPVGGGTGTGHAYDSSALDPATGDYYYLPLYAENVIRWTGTTWVSATGNVTGGTGSASSVRNVTWHPNLYGTGDGGLVSARSSASVRAWRKSSGASGSWVAIGSMPYSSVVDTQGVYCSGLDQAILSCGTTGLACLRVVPGTTPTVVRNGYDLPTPCTANATGGDPNMSRLIQTPSGSVAVLESASPQRVWRLNTSTFAWELQSFSHPLRNINASWPTAYVSTYGIYMAMRESNDSGTSLPSCLLWRPPSGF